MEKSFVLKGNLCYTKEPGAPELRENAYVVCADGICKGIFEEGYEFDAIVLDDSLLPHPQPLTLAQRMERAVYLGLDSQITAKYVAGRKIF